MFKNQEVNKQDIRLVQVVSDGLDCYVYQIKEGGTPWALILSLDYGKYALESRWVIFHHS